MIHEHILETIRWMATSHPDMPYVCLNGNCEDFAKILRSLFGGTIWYDLVDGHCYVLIGNHFYDIEGEQFPENQLFRSWKGDPS